MANRSRASAAGYARRLAESPAGFVQSDLRMAMVHPGALCGQSGGSPAHAKNLGTRSAPAEDLRRRPASAAFGPSRGGIWLELYLEVPRSVNPAAVEAFRGVVPSRLVSASTALADTTRSWPVEGRADCHPRTARGHHSGRSSSGRARRSFFPGRPGLSAGWHAGRLSAARPSPFTRRAGLNRACRVLVCLLAHHCADLRTTAPCSPEDSVGTPIGRGPECQARRCCGCATVSGNATGIVRRFETPSRWGPPRRILRYRVGHHAGDPVWFRVSP